MYESSASELAAQVRARYVSRREVLQAHLDRIDAIDGWVGAFVELRDPEQAMAKRLGSPTALVLTGISSAEDARAKRAPSVVLDDVTFFPDLLEAA